MYKYQGVQCRVTVLFLIERANGAARGFAFQINNKKRKQERNYVMKKSTIVLIIACIVSAIAIGSLVGVFVLSSNANKLDAKVDDNKIQAEKALSTAINDANNNLETAISDAITKAETELKTETQIPASPNFGTKASIYKSAPIPSTIKVPINTFLTNRTRPDREFRLNAS